MSALVSKGWWAVYTERRVRERYAELVRSGRITTYLTLLEAYMSEVVLKQHELAWLESEARITRGQIEFAETNKRYTRDQISAGREVRRLWAAVRSHDRAAATIRQLLERMDKAWVPVLLRALGDLRLGMGNLPEVGETDRPTEPQPE